MESEGKAIPFIQIDVNGSFSVSSESMLVLESLNQKKVCVITIAGPYRSGKSFLCNRLLNQQANSSPETEASKQEAQLKHALKVYGCGTNLYQLMMKRKPYCLILKAFFQLRDPQTLIQRYFPYLSSCLPSSYSTHYTQSMSRSLKTLALCATSQKIFTYRRDPQRLEYSSGSSFPVYYGCSEIFLQTWEVRLLESFWRNNQLPNLALQRILFRKIELEKILRSSSLTEIV